MMIEVHWNITLHCALLKTLKTAKRRVRINSESGADSTRVFGGEAGFERTVDTNNLKPCRKLMKQRYIDLISLLSEVSTLNIASYWRVFS
jgi:hypothetical protein